MQLITIAVVLCSILVASVGLNVWRMYGDFTKVVSTEFQLQSLTGKIVHLDEVLTMSARMAAATGELKWERRYRSFEPELDKAIAKAIDLAPETYANRPAETNAANLKLVEMENESFELIRQGKQQQALQLLFSPEYERQKKIYAAGINETINDLETRVESNLEYYRQSLYWSSLSSLLTFPILLIVWVVILRLINWYVKQRRRAETILKSAKFELEEINRTLESKVKERTAQLREINRTLESKVKERTAQLREAKEKAEAANLSKDRFLANISHELRTPLNSILGYANLIIRNDLDSKAENLKGLNIIKNSGLHLLTLINDILDYSKAEADKMDLNVAPLNLDHFLKETIDLVDSWAEEKGLQIEFQTTQDLPKDIQADGKRLRQVLINLLSNGIKFTETGKVTLKVSAIAQQSPNYHQKIRFEVIDTGIGISPDKIATIFNPFEQLGDSASKSSGTGLGLSISSQLVELMGGKIEVETEVNRGSTFWFDLVFPVIEMSFSQLQTRKKELTQILSGYEGKQRKILVVDDKPENRSLLQDILEPIGFKVIVAENGQEMLDTVRVVRPDLVLLDLFMPVKTGFTSVKELRQIPEFKNIPVLIVSASSITEQTRKYLNCDAYLNKPIDEKKLFSLLKQYLNINWLYQKVSYKN
ncbi:MAG: ATP-binding protein [Prochloraceae cyanobacterium]